MTAEVTVEVRPGTGVRAPVAPPDAELVIQRMPSGVKLPACPRREVWTVYWENVRASVAEGLCPHHSAALQRIRTRRGSGVIALSAPCCSGGYWYTRPSGAGFSTGQLEIERPEWLPDDEEPK